MVTRCFTIGNTECTILHKMAVPCRINDAPFSSCKEREKEGDKKERNFSLSWIFISRKGILHFDVSLEGQVGSLRNSSTKLCDSPEKETVFSLLCDGAQPRKFLPRRGWKERKKWWDIYIYIILPGIKCIYINVYFIVKKRMHIQIRIYIIDTIKESEYEFKIPVLWII